MRLITLLSTFFLLNSFQIQATPVSDPYAWLENVHSPETEAWLSAQESETEAYYSAAQSHIKERLTEISQFDYFGVPTKHEGNYYFLFKNSEMNQSALFVQDEEGNRKALVDPNVLCEAGTISLAGYTLSKDGTKLAYALRFSGTDIKNWYVLDLQTGIRLDDELRGLSFFTPLWSPDNQSLYYARFDEGTSTRLNQKIYHHQLGTSQEDDTLFLEFPEAPHRMIHRLSIRDDGKGVLVIAGQGCERTSGIWMGEIVDGKPLLECVVPEGIASYQSLGSYEKVLYFLTDENAPNSRILSYSKGEWKEVIPESYAILVEAKIVKGKIVCSYLDDAFGNLRIFDLDGKEEGEIPLPGKGSVTITFHGLHLCGNRNDPELIYPYTSFTTPTEIYTYNIETGENRLLFKSDLTWNPQDYTTTQVFYKSKDGTRIPMFLTHKRDLEIDGTAPTLLYGYGGFKLSITPEFNLTHFGWLEQGGILAVPNIRGGGEYGSRWHEAGMMEKKQNVFDDFLSAAEWLVENKYTSSKNLGIYGRSNGGLLVGACLTQHPELFGAAVVGVGVLDMLKFHKFTIGWAWQGEYGYPDREEHREFLQKYSPYHNAQNHTIYPSTLVITGEHDDRVVPIHSYKFTAALQEAQKGEDPILLRVMRDTGHGSGKSQEQMIDEASDILEFLQRELR